MVEVKLAEGHILNMSKVEAERLVVVWPGGVENNEIHLYLAALLDSYGDV